MSELIDEIMMNISGYVTDQMAVSNSLYITLEHYEITKKSTDIVEYKPQDNEFYIRKFLVAKKNISKLLMNLKTNYTNK